MTLQDRCRYEVGRHDEQEGNYHGDHSEMSEEEGFAGDTFGVKHGAGGRGDTHVDHPSNTLKHYRRNANSFFNNQLRGNNLIGLSLDSCKCACLRVWGPVCVCVCVRVCVRVLLLERFARSYSSV